MDIGFTPGTVGCLVPFREMSHWRSRISPILLSPDCVWVPSGFLRSGWRPLRLHVAALFTRHVPSGVYGDFFCLDWFISFSNATLEKWGGGNKYAPEYYFPYRTEGSRTSDD